MVKQFARGVCNPRCVLRLAKSSEPRPPSNFWVRDVLRFTHRLQVEYIWAYGDEIVPMAEPRAESEPEITGLLFVTLPSCVHGH
jgi:hypothetical protein